MLRAEGVALAPGIPGPRGDSSLGTRGAEQGCSRSLERPKQRAVCWRSPALQWALPIKPSACVLPARSCPFSLACGVQFPIWQLGLGPRINLSMADREALLVGGLQGLNSILWQRRVQVNSRWVWLWFGPENYFSRQRICSGGRQSPREAGVRGFGKMCHVKAAPSGRALEGLVRV